MFIIIIIIVGIAIVKLLIDSVMLFIATRIVGDNSQFGSCFKVAAVLLAAYFLISLFVVLTGVQAGFSTKKLIFFGVFYLFVVIVSISSMLEVGFGKAILICILYYIQLLVLGFVFKLAIGDKLPEKFGGKKPEVQEKEEEDDEFYDDDFYDESDDSY